MSFRNSTIVTGSALGLMLALGAANNASAGHGAYGYAPEYGTGAYRGYHGGNKTPLYGHGGHRGAPIRGCMPHPTYGYPRGAAYGYGYNTPEGMDGSCGDYKENRYFVETGMQGGKMTE
jgi:hypothetical protein